MTYVITQSCCNDASCVDVCPVNAIHPAPGAANFAATEMLYIDPGTCIDCAACMEACPVAAIHPADHLPVELRRYAAINAHYFKVHGAPPPPVPAIERAHPWPTPRRPGTTLRVAIVGTGPAGLYAAERLLAERGLDVQINLFERMQMPFGLARAGVAPDHPHTRGIVNHFKWVVADPRVTLFLNVEVGRHISHAELKTSHHAVLYAVGASSDRALAIPGESMAGSHSATEFVGWYNGHADFRDSTFDLDSKRAVVIGNGNVALDMARILLLDRTLLGTTDIADHALAALSKSRIEEVVVVGRRSIFEAAYTGPELLALTQLHDIDVVIAPDELDDCHGVGAADDNDAHRLRLQVAREIASRGPQGRRKRIVFRYRLSPVAILGETAVSAVEFARNTMQHDAQGNACAVPTDKRERVDAGLVLRAVGFLGSAVPGVPFLNGRIPNTGGRVTDQADIVMPGVYTSGWIKRGANGVMGTNRSCSVETVEHVLADFYSSAVANPPDGAQADLVRLLRQHQPALMNKAQWLRIDSDELNEGQRQNRPRVKIVSPDMALHVAGAMLTATPVSPAVRPALSCHHQPDAFPVESPDESQ